MKRYVRESSITLLFFRGMTLAGLAAGTFSCMPTIIGHASSAASSNSSAPISLSSVSPSSVTLAGGELLTLSGTGLSVVTQVSVAGQSCRSLQIQSNTELTCVAPPHAVVEYQDVVASGANNASVLPKAIAYGMVLGQTTLQVASTDAATGLSSPFGVSMSGGRLFVADWGNFRVLIYNSIPSSDFQVPDVVLGQPNLDSAVINDGGPSAQSLNYPRSVQSDGTRLFVADNLNNRVLIWNTVPTANFTPADVVLGQPNMSSSAANNGGLSASTFNSPTVVFSDGVHLFVADSGNNRVLIWNTIPTTNGQAADLVLGQPDLTHGTANNGPNTVACGSAAGRNSCSLSGPDGLLVEGSVLYVSDGPNNRILVWTTLPTSNQQAANAVLGQSTFTSGAANNGPNTGPCGGAAGLNACSLNGPQALASDGTRLVVADKNVNRVLIWNTLPTTNQVPANLVLGQSTFLTSSAGLTSQTLNTPYGVAMSTSAIFVSDNANSRILGWSPFPVSSGAAANLVLGQNTFTANAIDNPGNSMTASQLSNPGEIVWDGTHLMVSDRNNNRTLIWNSFPTSPGQSADVILGQPDAASFLPNNGPNTGPCGGAAGLNACSQSGALGISSDGVHVFVPDRANNRLLIWNSVPTTDGQPADLVLGQPTFLTGTANNGPNTVACGSALGRNACSMNGPLGAATDGTRLAVADSNNNRVLIWNAIPTSNQQHADLVLGQTTMTGGVANNGPNTVACGGAAGLNACSLSVPYHVLIANNHLVVSDNGNSRILIWNTFPTANGQAADVVIGQSTFFANGPNNGGISASTIAQGGASLTWDGTHLFASDEFNQRILEWNGFPTVNGQPANSVIGQSNFTTSGTPLSINGYSTSGAFGIASDSSRLFISDANLNRIAIMPTPQ